MKKLIYSSIVLGLMVVFTGCAKYEVAKDMKNLNVSFVDSKWNGNVVPKDEVCSDYNKGGGDSPKLLINNLPTKTNKIILAFSDESVQKMNHGGHGVVSYSVKEGTTNLTIPSFKGETFDLPSGFKSVQSHNGVQFGKTDGAYLPPCSGGRGNTYSVFIEAIHEYNEKDKKPLLLGEKRVRLGTY